MWYLAVPHGTKVFTDGSGIVDEQIWDHSRRVVWQVPELVEEVSTPDHEGEPAISPDGKTIYYTVGLPGGMCDLWMAQLSATGAVTDRRPLDEVNSGYDDRDPFPTESALYFVSNRPGGSGGLDLFIARRVGDSFGEPEPLPPGLNSPGDERRPSLTLEEDSLLFSSNRSDPGALGGFDLYLAKKSNGDAFGAFGDAAPLIPLNTRFDDLDPFLWPDGSRIVFASDREGGQGGLDLWWTSWTGTDWLAPETLAELNTVDDERSPSTTQGGFSLVFSSERPWGAGLSDVYRVESSELFPLPGERGILDLIAQVVFILLLLLALFAFLANRWKRLDVVVKCILMSLLLHLLLLLWFRTVELTGALDQQSTRGKSYKIRFVPRTKESSPAESNMVRGENLSAVTRAQSEPDSAMREEPTLEPVMTSRAQVTTADLRADAPTSTSQANRARSQRTETARPQTLTASALSVEEAERHSAADPSVSRAVTRTEVSRSAPVSRTSRAREFTDMLSKQDVGLTAKRVSSSIPTRARASEKPTRRSESRVLERSQAMVADAISPLAVEESEAIEALADSSLPALTSSEVVVDRSAMDAPMMSERQMDLVSAEPVTESSSNQQPVTDLPSSSELAKAEDLNRVAKATVEQGARSEQEMSVKPLDVQPVAPSEVAMAKTEEQATTKELPVQSFEVDRYSSPLEPTSFADSSRGRMSDLLVTDRLPTKPSPGVERLTGLPSLDLTRPVSDRRERPPSPLNQEKSLSALSEDQPLVTKAVPEEGNAVSFEQDPESALLTARIHSAKLVKRDVFDVSRGEFALAVFRKPPEVTFVALEHPVPVTSSVSRASKPKLSGLYAGRTQAGKKLALQEYGGSDESEEAVQRGLAYLAKIQLSNGSWGRNETDGKYGQVKIGKTSLSLLAFLASGHTQFSETSYSANVRRAIDYLLLSQDETTGHFGVTSSYSHGISTYALAESYAMTRDPRLKDPLVYAVAWILYNQYMDVEDPRWAGGWSYYYPDDRYVPDKWPRASVTAWQVMALKSAKIGGLDIPERHLRAARTYLRNSFDTRHRYFRYNHDPDRLRSGWPTLPASTPASVFALLLLGEDPEDPRITSATKFILDRRPRSYRKGSDDEFVLDAVGNLYFWYYSTLGMFLLGGEEWEVWNASVRDLLVGSQNRDGSWTPISHYSKYADERRGDFSYTTAMNVLTLEIYYRYHPPLLKQGR